MGHGGESLTFTNRRSNWPNFKCFIYIVHVIYIFMLFVCTSLHLLRSKEFLSKRKAKRCVLRLHTNTATRADSVTTRVRPVSSF